MSLRLCFGSLLCSMAIVFQANGALIINELDSDSVNTPTTDAFEFVELYDTSGTSVPLDGYTLVYFNGNGNRAYLVQDLDGFSTSATGYFTAGSIAGANLVMAGNLIQNGVDAVGLYLANGTDFTTGATGTLATATNLIDAVVYKTGADVDGVGLDTTLLVSGGVVDEFGRDGSATSGALDSIGRSPNGSGALRSTTTWIYMTPTPGAANTTTVVPEPASAMLLAFAGASVAVLRRRRSC